MFSGLCSRIYALWNCQPYGENALIFLVTLVLITRVNMMNRDQAKSLGKLLRLRRQGNGTVQATTRCARPHGRFHDRAARTGPICRTESCQAVAAGGHASPTACRPLRAGRVLRTRRTALLRSLSPSQVPRALGHCPNPTSSPLPRPHWHQLRNHCPNQGTSMQQMP